MRTSRLAKLAALISGLAVAFSLAAAQDSTPNPQSQAAPSVQPAPATPQQNQAQSQPQSQGASVDDQLQLTPEQKEKIASVVEDENKQIDAVRNDNSLSLEQKQQKALEIRQAGVPRMKAVLTQEQLQRLDAIVRQRQQSAPQAEPQQSPQH